MTSSVLMNLFSTNLVDSTDLTRGYMIVIDGKVYRDGLNKFIYPSKTAATKAFYNGMKWKTQYYAARHCPISERAQGHTYAYYQDPISMEDYTTLNNFKRFKRDLKNNHNFQIIRLG